MRALLAQTDPVPGDVAANLATVERLVGSRPDAELAVFPELHLSGYDLERIGAAAVAVDALDALGRLAAATSTRLIVGFAERLADGGIASSVAAFTARGERAAIVRKTHLFGRERGVLTAGDAIRAVDLGGVRVGVMVCFDVEFPEVARTLARAGADLLVTVAANMAPYGIEHRLLPVARAIENRRPHLYVNRAGREAGLHFLGRSFAVDASGDVIWRAGRAPHAQVVRCRIAHRAGAALDYLGQLRPELYHPQRDKEDVHEHRLAAAS